MSSETDQASAEAVRPPRNFLKRLLVHLERRLCSRRLSYPYSKRRACIERVPIQRLGVGEASVRTGLV